MRRSSRRNIGNDDFGEDIVCGLNGAEVVGLAVGSVVAAVICSEAVVISVQMLVFLFEKIWLLWWFHWIVCDVLIYFG